MGKEFRHWGSISSETIGPEHEIDMLGKYSAAEFMPVKKYNDRRETRFHPLIREVVESFPHEVKIPAGASRDRKVDIRINPERVVFKDIYNEVAGELLGEEASEDEEILKERFLFFNTLKTPLDKFYGTDAFFYYVDDKGVKHVCTIDVTKNTQKADGYKADVIMVGEPPSRKDAADEYNYWVRKQASEIIESLEAEDPRAILH